MNVSDILTRVKRVFGDEAGVQLVDTDIIGWINDAQRQIAANSELLQTRATADLVAGQMVYSTPSDMLNLRSVRVAGDRLVPIGMQEADDRLVGWDDPNRQETGKPEFFWQWANQMYLYPISDTSTTAGIVIYYSRVPVTVTTGSDVPELAAQYHDHIVRYCLRTAYELDENFQAANYSEGLFQSGLKGLAEDENKLTDEFYPTIFVRQEDMF